LIESCNLSVVLSLEKNTHPHMTDNGMDKHSEFL
jgi:hypothetical protein